MVFKDDNLFLFSSGGDELILELANDIVALLGHGGIGAQPSFDGGYASPRHIYYDVY